MFWIQVLGTLTLLALAGFVGTFIIALICLIWGR